MRLDLGLLFIVDWGYDLWWICVVIYCGFVLLFWVDWGYDFGWIGGYDLGWIGVTIYCGFGL